MQFTMFDGSTEFKINKPIRLIELFGGYGSQHFALEYLGANVEQWKLCEWAVKSIQAYRDAHFKNDNTDYSKDLTKEELIDFLADKGISANYNEPMSYEQVKRLSEDKLRTIYNNIKATHNLVNIQQVKGEDLEVKDTDKYCYVMTYSFPCQDLSLAGLGKGMEKGSGTRSGMLWEVERILDEINNNKKELPQVLLMENVPEVIGENNIKSFASWLAKLESLGYHCYWKVLNAKDFGIPQNRERCFMVSILGDYYYDFPSTIKLEHKLKDLLEDEVDESFYLSDRAINGIQNTKFNCSTLEARTEKNGIIPTLCARDYKDPKLVVEIKGREYPITKDNENFIEWKQKGFLDSDCRAWKDDKVSGTLTTNGRVQEFDVIRHSYSTSRINGEMKDIQQNNISPTLDTRCDCLGVVVNQMDIDDMYGETERKLFTEDGNIRRYINSDIVDKFENGQMATTTFPNGYGHGTRVHDESITLNTIDRPSVKVNYRIRKLTPKECFRLMGVKDQDYEKIAENQSNASLYHLAGDSICTPVLMAIFKEML